jgi:hypothetical protein
MNQRKIVMRSRKCALFSLCAAIASTLSLVTAVIAADNGNNGNSKCEKTGTLVVGVVAIGGETTGVVLHAKQGNWELDFQHNKELEKLAETLNKRSVTVTGTCRKIKGVEISERHIIEVTRLAPAGAK